MNFSELPISCYIRTLNEERMIGNVVTSAKKICSEVVIIDSLSIDKTKSISLSLGARVFEKHFTDDNSREGPDHKFALNPQSWREMVNLSNEVFETLGDGIKKVEENEKNAFVVQRRSIVAKRDLNSGTTISEEDLDYLRPCPEGSFHPYQKELLIGKRLKCDIAIGQNILIEMVD